MLGVAVRLIFCAYFASAALGADQAHWAFQPIKRPTPPARAEFPHPIDQFIGAKLEAVGLRMSAAVSDEEFIRRVTFDLIGLPPTPNEIDAFVNDRSPRARERLLDRLLASPHYGERWGRHWLDLARFAESDGFEHDAARPHAWRYRDYVIRAFNEDKPYDRFMREQIAGDELWPDHPEALTATAFNLLGPDMVDSSDQVQRRHNTLNDMTDTASLAFLGLTMGCARCHDHKFEPLSQRDYYSLQAFFTPARFNVEKPIPSAAEREIHEKALLEYNSHPLVLELAELESPVRKEIFEKKVGALSLEAQAAHRTPSNERNAEQANLVLETRGKVEITEADLAAAFRGNTQRRSLADAVKKLPKPPPLPRTMALESGAPKKTHVLHRGNYDQPRAEVLPDVPAVLRSSAGKTSGRAALANWLASPENPLTARVMVNRIWQHHFGNGIVATPSDFGMRGQPPTHPELLDWLASEFIARGWSIKQMHRLMMTSATYRQASEGADPIREKAATIDPANKLYWRMNRLRLEGEVIRDSLLAISGKLNSTMAGPGVLPPIPKELFAGAAGWKPTDRESDHHRRSIYIFARRNLRFPFLEVFDAPDNNLSCPSRERSTIAPQSLTLLNSDEVIAAAKLTADRLKDASSTLEKIDLAFRITLGREPSASEREIAREFLAKSPPHEFCRGLFNLNDFVYVR
jgi:hypothetical protein